MSILVRFAPSPTGYLHVGNVRTAIVNWLFAKKLGGKFMLRLDDTDSERSRPEYEAAILEDMNWLGLTWEEFNRQADRFPNYEAAKQKLIGMGRLYPCYETPEELDMRRKMQSGRGLPPIYDRASLKLSDEQKAKYAEEGRKPHYRFLLEDKPIIWKDLIRGDVQMQASHMSDPVLVRADGVPLYTIASVVDDGEMGVTHIIRGEDHVSNTAVQVQIFEALGFAVPTFGHLALIKTKEGELSKRVGGNDIKGLRAEGFEAMTVNSLLAKLGTSDSVEPFADMASLIASFDIAKFGRATANYDIEEVERLNEKLLAKMDYATAAEKLALLGVKVDEKLWQAVHGNIKKLGEVADWLAIINGEIAEPSVEDKEYLQIAANLLPVGDWDESTWGIWTKAISAATGRKGKELFMPIRKALTGLEHGPEMKLLLPLIGRDKVLQRL